ncbi:hypothetical protein CFC21_097728 [Triticum aestivum]|uniref:Rab-GAP TBC domain-containing protein n=3 Tax=Triticum TaxID=4564 RepID=A0A9R0ZB61_TRITD|nr:rab GTPase-activating protein 22-like [Triticum aestivum]KAF7095603.1 hypothetical protein CFC21_097728 [Triticum aestivum]VAI74725.1 unnamed protein product [Triticum turgidum subsp. durum]
MKALRRSSTSSSSSSSSSPRTPSSPPPSSSRIHRRSLLLVASSASSLAALGKSAAAASASASPLLAADSSSLSPPNSDRGAIKSPWSRRKRKQALSCQNWSRLFSVNGKFRDGGRKFLKKVRSGGIEPGIRAEVWPFLLGVYDLNSSEEERNIIKTKKRNEYKKLRRKCHQILNCQKGFGLKVINEINNEGCSRGVPYLQDVSASVSVSAKVFNCSGSEANSPDNAACGAAECMDDDTSELTCVDPSMAESESSGSASSDEDDHGQISVCADIEENCAPEHKFVRSTSSKSDFFRSNKTPEDFATWQRIIRLDAIRANTDWALFSCNQDEISEEKALQRALSVGLKDYDHLEPYMIYHAARLVALLEAYALYDPEIGYCQGMSDLLSPIIAVMKEDNEAFWCFVGFMKKARHNFRLDEVGIRRQLKTVSQIIKHKDSHLYRHLQKLQAEDCFFVYRMVLVLFRRELTFEQTLCLWEVMWADQAAVRAGIGRSTWGRIRLHAPPTDDLLLYAIAACVLQRRRLIIERYSSMDEILRECHSMAGQLDVWRLLDDAHDLVVNLHNKI